MRPRSASVCCAMMRAARRCKARNRSRSYAFGPKARPVCAIAWISRAKTSQSGSAIDLVDRLGDQHSVGGGLACDLLLRQQAPDAVHQDLAGLEPRLVGHLAALRH